MSNVLSRAEWMQYVCGLFMMFGKRTRSGALRSIDAAFARVEQDPGDVKAMRRLGDAYAKAGRIDDAVRVYLEAARLYAADASESKAIAVCKQALKYAPTIPEILSELVSLYTEMGRTAEALSYSQRLCDLYHDGGQLRLALSVVYGMQALAPNDGAIWLQLAELHLSLGEREEALSAYEEGLHQTESEGRWKECLRLAEGLLQVEPAHLGGLRLAGHAALQIKDTHRALGWLRQGFRSHRHDPILLEMMVEAFLRLGQTEKSLKLLEELADSHESSGEVEYARGYYEHILELKPSHERAKQALLSLSTLDVDWGVVEEEKIPLSMQRLSPSQTDLPATQDALPESSAGWSGNILDDMLDEVDEDVFASLPVPSYIDVDEIPQWLLQVETHLSQGLHEQARRVLDSLLQSSPHHQRALELQADMFVRLRQPDKAAGVLFRLAGEQTDPEAAFRYYESILAIEDVSMDLRGLVRNALLEIRRSHPALSIFS
jgi:tetratricopeptide (TPR) repeat protein